MMAAKKKKVTKRVTKRGLGRPGPRLMKTEILERDIHWSLEGNIDDAIKWLKGMKTFWGKSYDRLDLTIELDYPDPYSNDRSIIACLVGVKEETDEEYERRRAKELKEKSRLKADLEKREKAEFERLKKKFG